MTKRKTHDEFVKDVYDLVRDEYTVVGEYTLSKNNVLLRHNVCGNTWNVKANNFINGNRCKFCREKGKIKTTEVFKEEIRYKYDDNIKVVSEYVSYSEDIYVRCKKHNHKFKTTPSQALRKRVTKLCPKCKIESIKEKQTKDVELVIEQLYRKHKGSILLEGDYVNSHTKTLFRCIDCGHKFNSEPNSVLRISGCPNCKSSKGEKFIENFLCSHKVEYVKQKSYEDCKHIRNLYFDFHIPCINTLIEFDGLQHYKPIDFFGGEDNFKLTVERDRIKNNYAEDNNINLIRIPYYYKEEEIVKVLHDIVEKVKQGTHNQNYGL